ncbi:MAG TPA: MiaB/RimO family radical SAM methylthiotransferase [Desulfonatronum sp.]|nr:MiaB/RimO family radical SAM methylthiotransferase [Desulfonatronum sp.]
MKFYLSTLGCKVNQYETQVIREAWEKLGHCGVTEAGRAEVILVHGCAVTQRALADLRKCVAALHRATPDAPILITGCPAQTHGPELAGLTGVARVIGLANRGLILAGPDVLLAKQDEKAWTSPRPAVLEGLGDFNRARAQVKIQDGCSHGCTYCIVPLARGRHQSRAPRSVVEEIRRLLAAGFRELSLIGINLRQYGRDLDPGMDFWDLIRLLEQTFTPEWAGRARFRMSSLDPAMLDAKALDTLAGSRMLCPHLHLSLQSGSRDVLQRMGRGHCDPGDVAPFCQELAQTWPLFALGVDLLTGFPGERDAHFQETVELCSALPLSYAHVFPYSPRPGTPASGWPHQVPEGLRRKRAKVLRALAQRKKNDFFQKVMHCHALNMVVEGREPLQGKCQFYVACQVRVPLRGVEPRSLLCVRPVSIVPGKIMCEPAGVSSD